MYLHPLPLLLGTFLDLLLGDPHGLWHPVISIGRLISYLEKRLRTMFSADETGELKAGIALVLLVCGTTGAVANLLLWFAGRIAYPLEVMVETIMVYYLLAARSLFTESMKVYTCLKRGDVEAARYAVSMIVGRDTAVLDENGITKAAVETVAENTSDGVIAPLFFLALGGPVLGWVYKAVNTMDSMVGYQNDRYLYFGRAAAKVDDVCNYLPARLSALLMILAAYLFGYDGADAYRIWKRDRRNHKSPNSAQTESVCAGALHIRLAGPAWYFGKLHEKPYIGDDIRPVEAEDIRRANRLMYGTTGLMLLLCILYIL